MAFTSCARILLFCFIDMLVAYRITLKSPQEPKPKEPEVEWADTENDVIHLTDETFDPFIAENSKVMVFFYAPCE